MIGGVTRGSRFSCARTFLDGNGLDSVGMDCLIPLDSFLVFLNEIVVGPTEVSGSQLIPPADELYSKVVCEFLNF